ncbi:MAG: hypothetical protein SF051_12090 [Elusimicrobiota bacterium]|nr:hypothetical protein [Elusimicrobiota bacterium]
MTGALALLLAATAAAADPAPFAEVRRCGESWCLSPAFPAGKAVTVLGKPCRGVTGERGAVEWTSCPAPFAGDLAAVGARGAAYRRYSVKLVTDAGRAKAVDALVRRSPGFAARYARLERRLRDDAASAERPYEPPVVTVREVMGRPGASRAYTVGYDPEPDGIAMPYLLTGSAARPLTDTLDECGGPESAFEADGRPWLHAHLCPCAPGAPPAEASCRAAFFPL